MDERPAQYIAAPEPLAALCARLREAPWIAFDTEFVRDRTYYPKLCLLQVADAHGVACVDPLALEGSALDPLLDVLLDPSVTKVMHSGEQDLETIHQASGRVPQNIFDTQIAATLLGHRDQVSYAELVESTLGVELGKAHTRTNWARRPLGEGPLRYAADDVRHLRGVYRTQVAELEALGRLDWLVDDFAALSDPARYEATPLDAWQRVRGRGKLRGPQLAVLQGLAEWREHEAMRANRPRRWIIDDETVVELACALPKTPDAPVLKAMKPRRREAIAGVVRASLGKTPRESPRKRKTSPAELAEVDRLAEVVQRVADANGIDASTLASKRLLRAHVRGDADDPLARGWRGALLGPHLAAAAEEAGE